MFSISRVLHCSCAAVGVLLALFDTNPAAAWTYRILHSFCSQPNCADGEVAGQPLVMDQVGNLYGVTESGGTGWGTVFQLKRKGSRWTEHVLYSFCPDGLGKCLDGYNPNGLVLDASGNLYGTTVNGGPPGPDAGTAFKLIKHKNGQWSFQPLY